MYVQPLQDQQYRPVEDGAGELINRDSGSSGMSEESRREEDSRHWEKNSDLSPESTRESESEEHYL